MNRMSVTEIAKAVSAKHGLKQETAETFVTSLFKVINDGLHNDKAVKVRGLGTFKIIDVRERESVNVNTGERVTIEGHGKINFTPDSVMRDLVNKPFAKFETVVLNDGVELDELNKVNGSAFDDDDDESADNEADITTEQTEEVPETHNAESVHAAVVHAAEVMEAISPSAETNRPEEEEPVHETVNDIPESSVPTYPAADEAEEETVKSIFNNPTSVSPENTENETEAGNVILAAEKTDTEESSTGEGRDTEKSVENSTEQEEDNIDDDTDNWENSSHRRNRVLLIVSAALLIAVTAFACGYLLGQDMASRPVFKTVKVYNIVRKKPVADTVKTTVAAPKNIETDSKKTAEDKEKTDEEEKGRTAATAENVPVKNEEQQNGTALSTAKRQVRTGAYTITGTEQTITVKKGQTLKKISKLYLGDGMECYIQVHNNMEELSEGMKVKIPKLKLKKH